MLAPAAGISLTVVDPAAELVDKEELPGAVLTLSVDASPHPPREAFQAGHGVHVLRGADDPALPAVLPLNPTKVENGACCR